MLRSLLRIVLRRSLGHWKLLSVVAIGVVVAAALMASTAIYSDAIRDLGLSFALRQVPRLQLDLLVQNSGDPARPREYAQRRQTLLGTVQGYGGRWIGGSTEYGKSATFFLTAPGQPVPADEQRPRSFFQYQQDLADHVRVVDGTFSLHTDPAADPTQPPTLKVVVGKQTADAFGIHVGDHFDMHPFWHLEVQPISVVVGGIIEPKDANEEYWSGRDDRFAVTSTTWRTYPFFIDQQTMSAAVAGYLPDTSVDYSTLFYVNTGSINADSATRARDGFHAIDVVLRQNLEHTTVDSKLADTIATYQQKLFFTRLPLFALILQVVGIVLYYVVMVSTMLVDREAAEIALLKSRGASTRQIVSVYALEGGAIALLAVILGPLLAAGVVKSLGPTPPFHALSTGHLLSVRISAQAIGLAAIGAALSLLALLWPAFRASRFSLVRYRQATSRPPQQPLFTRYYLDVFLIVVGGALFYELRQRGSLVTKQIFGDLKADPLLLVTPMLFTLMIALLFLRLFPLLLRLAARVLGPVSGTSVLLGLWHMVRSPVHYSRLILLLILATSLGMFAAGFRATLDRSYQDRAAYQAGAPVRVQGIRSPSGLATADLADRVQQAVHGSVASPVQRTTASYNPRQFSSVDATVLAVDPATFSRTAYWRDDFSGRSLGTIMRTLARNEPQQQPGLAVPDNARWLGVWVQTPSAASGYTLAARLVDRNGRVLDYSLNSAGGQQPAAGDWAFFSTALDQPGTSFRREPPPVRPLRFLSLYVRTRASQQTETIQDYVAGLQVSSAAALSLTSQGFADATPLDGFDDPSKLEPVAGLSQTAPPDSFGRVQRQSPAGNTALQLSWTRDRNGVPAHGIMVRDDGQPVIAYVSSSLLSAAGLHDGQTVTMYVEGSYVPVRIAGSFSYFPTFDAGSSHNFLVADLARLVEKANRVPGSFTIAAANEVWVAGGGLSDDAAAGLRRAGVTADEVDSLSQIVAQQQHDPLIAASWEGILFLAFGAALLLTALGFVVYSYLTARARSLEFAVLRTMGLSTEQIAAVVGFELFFVVALGVIAGTFLGLPLSRLMIGYMGLTETGASVVPPLVSRVSWQAVAGSYAGVAIVFVAAVVSLVLLYARLSVSRVLRMGES